MRLLVALDGSPSSLQARDLVGGLPWANGTAITLMTAWGSPIAFMTPELGAGPWLERTENAVREQAHADLAGYALPLANRGWAIEQRLEESRPADAILAVADDIGADLIVLGSRGRGRIKAMLLGSVSAEVAAQARQSVLIARQDQISRVVVATDGSDFTMAIPEILGTWDVLRGLPAVALSVAPTDSPVFEMLVSLYTMGDASMKNQRDELVTQYEDAASDMARRLSAIGILTEAETRQGDVPHEIVEAVAAHRADLVVTGSRRLGATDRFLLGSVGRDVLLHTAASVLIVRAGGQSARGE